MSFAAAALRMFSGAIVWAFHFAVLYGFAALACARGLGAAVPWVAGGATLAALAAMGVIIARALPQRGEFIAWMTVALAALALVGVVYETVPLFIVPACA